MPLSLTIALSILFAFVPSFGWLVFWYRKDKSEPEPKRMIAMAFVFGMLAVLPLLAIRWQLQYSPNLMASITSFSKMLPIVALVVGGILFAVLEESLKHFATLRLGKKLRIEFTQIVDGVVYSISAALGFAFAENLFYFYTLLQFYNLSDTTLWTIIAFRGFGTTLGHALFSGIFGLFWGHAFLSSSVTPRHSYSVSNFFHQGFDRARLHIIFRHILKDKPSLHGHEKADLVREALVLATLFHALFNILIGFEIFGQTLTPFVVPILLLGSLFLSKQFMIRDNVNIMTPVPIRTSESIEK